MNHFFKLAVASAAIAASLSAHADLLDVTFSGIVTSQNGSSFAANAPITGEFFFDTVSGTFSSFTVGDQAVAAGYTSSAAITPETIHFISPIENSSSTSSDWDEVRRRAWTRVSSQRRRER